MTVEEQQATIVAALKTAELAAILLAGRGVRAKTQPSMGAQTYGEAAIEDASYLLGLAMRRRLES